VPWSVPYADARAVVRSMIGTAFVEVYVHTPLSVCEKRDP
jgi:adenylylsulfate kinase-like enzyme